jgi:hypothetical protein
MEAFHEVADECFRYFDMRLARGDYEYVVERGESTNGYQLLYCVRKNRPTPPKALKNLLIKWKDSEANKFVVTVMMKEQQQKAASFNRSANLSFYVN